MQTAKLNDTQARQPLRRPGEGGSNVPARVAAIPIEPPHPREVAEKLDFRTANQYKRAVALAERYLWQSKLAVERRKASVKKADRQALLDHEETLNNYQRQVTQAQNRYKALIEQAHAKHRQAVYQARVSANQAEELYKQALRGVPGYGDLQLKMMALNDARAVTVALVNAYKGALGPDGLGNLTTFLAGLDKTLDLARDRSTVVPMQFAEALLKAVVSRQVKAASDDKIEAERLKQAGGQRLLLIQAFLNEERDDATPPSIRAVYFGIHEWLTQAKGTPFDLALDRLKLDVDTIGRREQRILESHIEEAINHNDYMHMVQPVAEGYQRGQRVLLSSEQAAKNVLHQDVARIETQLEKEIQLADAMVVGMDHTAAMRLTEAKKALGNARRMVGRWGRVLDELEDMGAWQRFLWRLTENFDHESFWFETRARLRNRH